MPETPPSIDIEVDFTHVRNYSGFNQHANIYIRNDAWSERIFVSNERWYFFSDTERLEVLAKIKWILWVSRLKIEDHPDYEDATPVEALIGNIQMLCSLIEWVTIKVDVDSINNCCDD